jgi:hypothetical protein
LHILTFIQGLFYIYWCIHGCALHGDQCTAGCEAHASFANESADNIWNEVVTFDRSQLLKMPYSLQHIQHTRHKLSLDGFSNCVAILALDFNTPVSWARCFSDFLGVCLSLSPMSCNFSVSTLRCSKSIHQIVNAGNPFITKFMSKVLSILLSRSIFHIAVIQKYTCSKVYHILLAPHYSLNELRTNG